MPVSSMWPIGPLVIYYRTLSSEIQADTFESNAERRAIKRRYLIIYSLSNHKI